MISSENLGSIAGAPVEGADGDRIGTVGQIFADPASGVPTWVTVHTGLFGRHETFVPLENAEWDREVLHIPYDKNRVKDAPRIDTEGSLHPELEVELSRYYGLSAVEPSRDEEGGVESSESLDPSTTESESSEGSTSASDEPDPHHKARHRA